MPGWAVIKVGEFLKEPEDFLSFPLCTCKYEWCLLVSTGKGWEALYEGSRLPPLGALEHLVPIPTPLWSGLHTVLCKWTGGRLTFSDPWGPWSERAWALQSLGAHLGETLPSPVHRCWNFLTEFFGSCVKERHHKDCQGTVWKHGVRATPPTQGHTRQTQDSQWHCFQVPPQGSRIMTCDSSLARPKSQF